MTIRSLYIAAVLSIGCGSSVRPGVAQSPQPSTGAFISATTTSETRSNVFASNGSGVRRIDADLLSETHD